MPQKLFTPITLKSITLKNRIVVSPMCQYSALDGFANDWHLVHLVSRAVGGAGLIIQEATAVSPEGRISLGDLGLWDDVQIEKLKQITDFIKGQNAVPAIQLAHAGRKGSCHAPFHGGKQLAKNEGAWQTVGPSELAFEEGQILPKELDKIGIEKIVSDFKSATRRAVMAGYQVMEIHAAHGYLLHQFLSPISNIRTDEYGGSFENRIRLTLEILEAVQMEWPADLPLFVRISAQDWAEGGWSLSESIELSKILKEKGVDLIDVSSGGLTPIQKIALGPCYQVPFAEEIKNRVGIATGAVGLITNAHQAETILQENQADLVFFAREALRNPYFPLNFARELETDISWPKQYERAKVKISVK